MICIDVIDINAEPNISIWILAWKVASYVFNPLCVAAPLAKKRASMYAKPPAGYNRIDPTIAAESI